MTIFLQISTILGMLLMTYMVFIAFGKPRTKLLFTKQEKVEWDAQIGQKIGSWFTKTNIIGSLTSLATVYVFFIGSSKLFGAWIFLCSITIWLGAYITNYFTTKICENEYIASMLNSADQTGGVISCLFWRPDDRKAQITSLIVKWISLVNIVAVIWFEFSLFADISSGLINNSSIFVKILLLAITCFSVIFFTLKYGLRGFVFADFFQTPLIALGAVILLIGVIVLSINQNLYYQSFQNLLIPILTTKDCILFAIQVFSLNLLLVLVTESHWLRVWIFGNKETKLQVTSTFYTGLLWGVMALIGLIAFSLTNSIGVASIISLIQKMASISNIFLIAFWVGAMGALFSTADAQIYSFLVVNQFSSSTGKLKEASIGDIKPIKASFLITCLFVFLFFIVQYLKLPFEKIIFIAIPLCLNIFPSFVLSVLNLKQDPKYIVISLVLYIVCSVLGFYQPPNEFSWTLMAPFCPIIISIFICAINFLRK